MTRINLTRLSVVLLIAVLAALVGDLSLRTTHAQTSPTVYLDAIPHHFKERHDKVVIQGTDVIGFHCADGSCYVLSK